MGCLIEFSKDELDLRRERNGGELFGKDRRKSTMASSLLSFLLCIKLSAEHIELFSIFLTD